MPAQDQLPLGQFKNRSGTNEMGRVLPNLYGTNRVGCTFISEFFDILATTVSSGGKGGSVEGTNNYASFAVMIGHGPYQSISAIYLNSTPVWTTGAFIYPVSVASVSNVVTVQTSNPHGLESGDTIFMFWCFPIVFNGQYTVTVVSPTQFQYTIPGSSIPDQTAVAQNGQNIYFEIALPPIVANGADSTAITIPNFGTATIYWGTLTQNAADYMSTTSGIQHPPYKGLCYIVFRQLFLGFNQTNAQNVEIVGTRIPTFAWQSNPAHSLINNTYGDCNPGSIIADMLLNPRCGLGLIAGVDVNTAMLDAAIEQFYGYGYGLSPITTREDETRSQFLALLENVDASPAVDSNGLLGIIFATPPASNVVNGDLVYDCPTVAGDDLTDLPSMTPGSWDSVINCTRLTYIDQDAGWAKDYVMWADNAGVYGKARQEPQTLDRPMVTHQDLATYLCGVCGQISALPKTTGRLQLAWDDDLYASLTPGAPFYFEHPSNADYNDVYRITAVNLPDPAKPVLEIEMEIDRSYLYQNAATQLVEDAQA